MEELRWMFRGIHRWRGPGTLVGMLNGEMQTDGGEHAVRRPTARSSDEENRDASVLEVHLVLEKIGDGEPAIAHEKRLSTVPLPTTGLWLGADDAGNPRVIEKGEDDEAGVAVVPVGNRTGQRRVLLLPGAECELRINGFIVPRVALARELDVVQWHPGFQIHVVLFGRPKHGLAPSRWVGRECPHCRTPFTAQSRCLMCVLCGTPVHEETADSDLRCAAERSTCPVCNQPLLKSPGYLNMPDLD